MTVRELGQRFEAFGWPTISTNVTSQINRRIAFSLLQSDGWSNIQYDIETGYSGTKDGAPQLISFEDMSQAIGVGESIGN